MPYIPLAYWVCHGPKDTYRLRLVILEIADSHKSFSSMRTRRDSYVSPGNMFWRIDAVRISVIHVCDVKGQGHWKLLPGSAREIAIATNSLSIVVSNINYKVHMKQKMNSIQGKATDVMYCYAPGLKGLLEASSNRIVRLLVCLLVRHSVCP